MKILGMRYRLWAGVILISLLSACASKNLGGAQAEVSISAENAEAQKRASIRMQLAVGYYQQGQHKVALEEIRQVLLIAPELVDAYSVRALIFMDIGEKQLAEDNFLHALKLAPNNPDILNNYGWFLCQNGREKQALDYFEKVAKDQSYQSPAKVLNNAGLCSLRLKDVAAAERYFMLGFREEPGNPSVNANMAKILFDRAEYEQARFYINRVIKSEIMAADVLWLAIKIENKLGDQAAVSGLSTQLRRRHPGSREFALLQRGAFNE